ncbi:MAG: hypothetical protein CME65_05615 [Halobacteriovoraceae bacterium]|nr:hypothetical protein [Halobacteriovoraceae bacterium]|tara:strand:+ start:406 stop:1071 length:666 start_codon:yes stop_codon:yes gene_type:complete
MKNNPHQTRDFFKLGDFLKARDKTVKLIDLTVSKLEEGMKEPDCIALLEKLMKDFGVEKKWHPTKFRIGSDTLKSFSEKSTDLPPLKDGEIFFIDIGPVWENYEGDYGQTFIFNQAKSEFSELASKAQQVFKYTKDQWVENNLSGTDLYKSAEKYSETLGVKLNMNMGGHRLGDFPHHLFYRGDLAEINEAPVDNLWVLEILIADQKLNRGAFFEDILIKA